MRVGNEDCWLARIHGHQSKGIASALLRRVEEEVAARISHHCFFAGTSQTTIPAFVSGRFCKRDV